MYFRKRANFALHSIRLLVFYNRDGKCISLLRGNQIKWIIFNVHESVHRNNILVYNSNKMHKSCASCWNYILENKLYFFLRGGNRQLLVRLTKQTLAFRKKYHTDKSTFTCSNLPCFHPHTTGCKQAVRPCTSHEIATGFYIKTLVTISLLFGPSKPSRGALSLGIDISYEYIKYEVAVDKRLVWRQAVGAATDDFLV
jgi:hypothetical protein